MKTDLTPVEQYVLAYFLAYQAPQFSMDPRFFPTSDILVIVGDKVRFAANRFNITDDAVSENVTRALVAFLLERGGFSSTESNGATMHQYQRGPYLEAITELQESNPIIAEAEAGDTDFWDDAFARLSA